MYDRGNERRVEQELTIEEGQTQRAIPDVRVPVGGDGYQDRRHQRKRRDEDIGRGNDFELERGGEVDRDRDAHPPDVDGAEERLGSRNRRRR